MYVVRFVGPEYTTHYKSSKDTLLSSRRVRFLSHFKKWVKCEKICARVAHFCRYDFENTIRGELSIK